MSKIPSTADKPETLESVLVRYQGVDAEIESHHRCCRRCEAGRELAISIGSIAARLREITELVQHEKESGPEIPLEKYGSWLEKALKFGAPCKSNCPRCKLEAILGGKETK